MARRNNYAIMADQTRKRFLTYDQNGILANIPVRHDGDSFYLPILNRECRICRHTGHIFWLSPGGTWIISTDPGDSITIFDYLCDAKPGRIPSGEFAAITGFGHMFHTGLAESSRPTALELSADARPGDLHRACQALGGVPSPWGDVGYLLPLFPDLNVQLRFWHSDEDFPPQIRFFWDRKSLSWLRYETMYYAQGMILDRLSVLMDIHKDRL
jgi:hypothetical protein